MSDKEGFTLPSKDSGPERKREEPKSQLAAALVGLKRMIAWRKAQGGDPNLDPSLARDPHFNPNARPQWEWKPLIPPLEEEEKNPK